MKLVDLKSYRDAPLKTDLAVAKSFSTRDAAVNDEKRTIDFTISTEDIDRYGDIVKADGWKLDNYKQNPVVLWGHMSWQPPIGKAIAISAGAGALRATAQFATKEVNPLAETVYQLIKMGALRATSVGFLPIAMSWTEDKNIGRAGYDITEAELLEFSVVSVPANPYALVAAEKSGLDVKFLKDEIEQVLDTWVKDANGLVVPRAAWEAAQRSAAEPTVAAKPIKVKIELDAQDATAQIEEAGKGFMARLRASLGLKDKDALVDRVEPKVDTPESQPKQASADAVARVRAAAEAMTTRHAERGLN